MEPFESSVYLVILSALIVGIIGALAGLFAWYNWVDPWLKSRSVAIRGKDGRR